MKLIKMTKQGAFDMKHNFNGERLKKARLYNGYTPTELSREIGCSSRTINMYENGQIKTPDSSMIESLSKVLDFPTEYFFEPIIFKVQDSSTYFRSLLTVTKKYRDEQHQKIEIIATVYDLIREYIDFPVFIPPEVTPEDTPEDAAYKLRVMWNLDNKPIENINFIVEDNGIITTTFQMSTDKIDAFSKKLNDIYLIGYSSNKTSAARIHFDVAHELGHICLHGWNEDIESLRENKTDFKNREEEANAFAAAFLLPKQTFYPDVKQDPRNIEYYIKLKKKWGVSIAAMIRRAYSFNLLSPDDYQWMMRSLQKRGIRKEEPLDDTMRTVDPTLLKTAMEMLLEDDVFTPKEFIDELSYSRRLTIYPHTIESLLNLPEGMLAVPIEPPKHKLRLLKSNTN